MAATIVTLDQGLTIGEEKHTEAELREVTAGDLLDAGEDSEKLVETKDGGTLLVSSATLMGAHVLRRQIVRLGTHPGPLAMPELRSLSGLDYALLQEKAEQLEQATLEAMLKRGRAAAGDSGTD